MLCSPNSKRSHLCILTAIVAVLVSGCNDDSSPSGGAATQTPRAAPPPAPTPTNNAPAFTAGRFPPSDQLEDQCQVVRRGEDIEGNSFPDKAGSTLLENFWLRSWSNETYLFKTEIVDRDPAGFSDTVSYFDTLRTMAVTPSGEDKDDFHFSEPTADFLARRNSAARAGYGARFLSISSSPPRDFRVAYADPDTPAAELSDGRPNFVRGARILEIDGIDFVNGGTTQADLDALNNALFPRNVGETHTFVVREPGQSEDRTVSITSANVSNVPVNRTRVITTSTGRVGYILFNTFSPFSSEQAIAEAVTEMDSRNIDDLVLDLRYNGGGLLAVASQLSYMIAGNSATNNRTFETLVFNTGLGGANPVTGSTNNDTPFFRTGLGFSLSEQTDLASLDLRRVFILSTEQTCSASESVINALRGINIEVILIGNTTCGKPFGFYPTGNCGRTYYTIQFQGVNDIGFGAYADGFTPANSTDAFGEKVPGCLVNDDFSAALGNPNEAVLRAALQFQATGTCPTPPSSSLKTAVASRSSKGSSIAAISRSPVEELLLNSRDLTMP